jgi:hypothetical protein
MFFTLLNFNEYIFFFVQKFAFSLSEKCPRYEMKSVIKERNTVEINEPHLKAFECAIKLYETMLPFEVDIRKKACLNDN